MAELKLGRLPDRMPVKLAINVAPELHTRLVAYAALYKETYGEAEPVTELIPHMLVSFLDGDRVFSAASRQNMRDPK